MYSNALMNSLQNVVVSSAFIKVLGFLNEDSFSISTSVPSISLEVAFGSFFLVDLSIMN